MWRSEEKLEFWLAGGKPSLKQARGAWLRKLRLNPFTVVQETPLDIDSRMGSLDDALSASTNIHDGFNLLSESGTPTDSPETAGQFWSTIGTTTRSIRLLGGAPIRRIPMPDAQRTRMRQEKLVMPTPVQPVDVSFRSTPVHLVESLQDRQTRVQDGSSRLLKNPAIFSTMRVSELPHRCACLFVDKLSDSEKQSFLREAEVLKHVPPDRAELLAVFRHVPIEMISRLHFLDEKKEIQFSIASGLNRTQTRVHDMAVIRDTASQEIHLVPHRTKCTTVLLT
jgi:hypothetical protein